MAEDVLRLKRLQRDAFEQLLRLDERIDEALGDPDANHDPKAGSGAAGQTAATLSAALTLFAAAVSLVARGIANTPEAFAARATGKHWDQVLRDAAATPAVRVLRAEALRELGRLLLEAAAMHREVAVANSVGDREPPSAKQQMEDAMMRMQMKRNAADDAMYGA
ncbi:hypothetical protein WJX81_001240 [Elliptochloris bilobata]|uniref:Uncharacterized protein n=1 Tax=Elliptochloris bilobata TaxID=381761 RepID=A0AAW1RZZ3_9CHLO